MATEYVIGNVKGPQGNQGIQGSTGISVSSSAIDANGHLIQTLSDGTKIDAGVARGDPTTVNGQAGQNITLAAKDIGIAAIPGLTANNTQAALTDLTAQMLEKANAAEVDASLAGKTTSYRIIPANVYADPSIPYSYTGTVHKSTVLDLPYADWAHIIYVPHGEDRGLGAQIAMPHHGQAGISVRSARGVEWGEWKQFAPTENPAFTGRGTINSKEIPTTESQKLTLLNGWTNYYQDYNHLRMTRVGGLVTVTGIIKAGISTNNTTVAVFPNIPKATAIFFANTDATPTTQARFCISDTGMLVSSSGVITGGDYLINITAQQA